MEAGQQLYRPIRRQPQCRLLLPSNGDDCVCPATLPGYPTAHSAVGAVKPPRHGFAAENDAPLRHNHASDSSGAGWRAIVCPSLRLPALTIGWGLAWAQAATLAAPPPIILRGYRQQLWLSPFPPAPGEVPRRHPAVATRRLLLRCLLFMAPPHRAVLEAMQAAATAPQLLLLRCCLLGRQARTTRCRGRRLRWRPPRRGRGLWHASRRCRWEMCIGIAIDSTCYSCSLSTGSCDLKGSRSR